MRRNHLVSSSCSTRNGSFWRRLMTPLALQGCRRVHRMAMELSNDPLVVAVVLTAAPQSLRREVKKFRTRLRKKKGQIPELKASQSVLAWNRKRLERLAKLDIEVVVVAAEKIARARFHEPEELYRLLCARAVEECLRRSPSLTLCIDKRYTNPTLRTIQDHTMQIPVQQFG